MAFEIKLNNGFLYPNKYHQKGDKKPCITGKANIGGIEYEISIWAPKPGKKNYFMVAKVPEGEKPTEQKPADISHLEPVKEEAPPKPPEPIQTTLSNCSF
jgi:hypothetical protein